jgi:hypothetical protein
MLGIACNFLTVGFGMILAAIRRFSRRNARAYDKTTCPCDHPLHYALRMLHDRRFGLPDVLGLYPGRGPTGIFIPRHSQLNSRRLMKTA